MSQRRGGADPGTRPTTGPVRRKSTQLDRGTGRRESVVAADERLRCPEIFTKNLIAVNLLCF